MIRKPLKFWIFLLLTVLWMCVIFWKSSQTYQQQDIKPWLHTVISEQTLARYMPPIEFTYDGDLVTYQRPYGVVEFFIRKGGHVSEYLILAFLSAQTLTATRLSRPALAGITMLFSVLYAASDEWHQTFVPNRTGHPIDVGVDSIGALLGLLLVLLFTRSKSRRNKKLS
jgi:VanZ family protein